MIEPVKELTAAAKAHGCYVLIDGAHAPGVLSIDVEDIGAGISYCQPHLPLCNLTHTLPIRLLHRQLS